MNPRAVLLIAVGIGVIVWLVVWWLGRRVGVRRADFERIRKDRNLLAHAIAAIDEKADAYRDIDSVLAADVRAIVRALNAERMELNG